ncbi:MAG: hypothetical protein MUF14_10525 [Hyphomonadaceae bacterium]|jgi:hypothetical protein|nr:hypothetical protein [Hyphomonadaceae bacterium]
MHASPLPAAFYFACIPLVLLHCLEEALAAPGMTQPAEMVALALLGEWVPYFPMGHPLVSGLVGLLSAAALAWAGLKPEGRRATWAGAITLGLFASDALLVHAGAIIALGGPSSQTLGRVVGIGSALFLLLPMALVWVRLAGWAACWRPVLVACGLQVLTLAVTLIVLVATG